MGGPDGYLSPVQFLDHLTVIKNELRVQKDSPGSQVLLMILKNYPGYTFWRRTGMWKMYLRRSSGSAATTS